MEDNLIIESIMSEIKTALDKSFNLFEMERSPKSIVKIGKKLKDAADGSMKTEIS